MKTSASKSKPEYAEEFLITVCFHRSPDHLIRRGSVMADMGFSCPDPPPTDDEMQAVTYAAKMAMIKVLRARKRRLPRNSDG